MTSLILLAASMAGTSSSHALQIFETPDDGDGYSLLILNGIIEFNDSKRIDKFLQEQAREGTPVAMIMTSSGGGLEETPRIAEAMINASNLLAKKFKNKRNLFAVNIECSSACTALTARLTSGRDPKSLEMLITNSSKWGFHSPVNYVNKKVSPIADVAERDRLIAKQISYYTKAGVSTKWLTANAEMFKTAKMTDLEARKLCAEKSLVIPPTSCVPDQDITELITRKLVPSAKKP